MQECVDTTGVRDSCGGLQHGVARDVRDIDQHAEPVQLGDRGAAERAEAAMLGRRVAQVGARIAGIRQRVVAVVRQRQIARAERPEARQPRQVVAHREAVLHRRHDRQHAVALGRVDLVGGDGDARGDAVLAAPHAADRMQHGDGALERGGLAFGRARGLRHVGDEAAGGEAAALHLRQIDPARAVQERIGAGRPGDVDVRVEGQQAAMQRKRVGGDCVVHGADARRYRRDAEGAGLRQGVDLSQTERILATRDRSSTLDEPMPARHPSRTAEEPMTDTLDGGCACGRLRYRMQLEADVRALLPLQGLPAPDRHRASCSTR